MKDGELLKSEDIHFDVLLTYYGRDEMFKECVRSILAQTHKNFRLLVVDDCYPEDKMLKWCESLDDNRVEYIKNPQNLGIIPNFANALSLAKADWVCFPGSDDKMAPRHLELSAKSIAEFENQGGELRELAVYSSNFSNIDASGKVIHPLIDKLKHLAFWLYAAKSKPAVLSGDKLVASLCRVYWTQWPCLIFNREIAQKVGVNLGFENNADQVLLDFALMLPHSKMLVNPERTMFYRRHKNSGNAEVSRNGKRWVEDDKMYDEIGARAAEIGFRRTVTACKNRLVSKMNRRIGKYL